MGSNNFVSTGGAPKSPADQLRVPMTGLSSRSTTVDYYIVGVSGNNDEFPPPPSGTA